MPLKFGWSITTEYGTSNHCPGSVGLCGCFNRTLYPPFAIIPLDFRGLAISGITTQFANLIRETLEPRVELWSHQVMRIGCADPEKRNRTQSHHASYDQPVRTRRSASIESWEPPFPQLPSVGHRNCEKVQPSLPNLAHSISYCGARPRPELGGTGSERHAVKATRMTDPYRTPRLSPMPVIHAVPDIRQSSNRRTGLLAVEGPIRDDVFDLTARHAASY